MSDKELRLQNYHSSQASHWSFLIVIFTSFFLSDQVYTLIDLILPKLIDNVSRLTGNYTYPVLVSILYVGLIRLSSRFLPELNIDQKPDSWIWMTAILILVHPLLIYQDSDGLNVDFKIFGMLSRTFDGSDEFFIFIISSLIYIFATFGAIQILFISDKMDKIDDEKLSKLISIDILPITAIVLIFIYLVQSGAGSQLKEFDYSEPIKIIVYVIFGYSSIPNITHE
ncbi:MAG: hypothetical protein ACW99A_07540 [Candidatus Kariarchaeaceae archaeon]